MFSGFKHQNTKGKLAEIKITVLCMGIDRNVLRAGIDRNVLRALEVNVNVLFLGRQGQVGESI